MCKLSKKWIKSLFTHSRGGSPTSHPEMKSRKRSFLIVSFYGDGDSGIFSGLCFLCRSISRVCVCVCVCECVCCCSVSFFLHSIDPGPGNRGVKPQPQDSESSNPLDQSSNCWKPQLLGLSTEQLRANSQAHCSSFLFLLHFASLRISFELNHSCKKLKNIFFVAFIMSVIMSEKVSLS